jgi:hypothetical protein
VALGTIVELNYDRARQLIVATYIELPLTFPDPRSMQQREWMSVDEKQLGTFQAIHDELLSENQLLTLDLVQPGSYQSHSHNPGNSSLERAIQERAVVQNFVQIDESRHELQSGNGGFRGDDAALHNIVYPPILSDQTKVIGPSTSRCQVSNKSRYVCSEQDCNGKSFYRKADWT